MKDKHTRFHMIHELPHVCPDCENDLWSDLDSRPGYPGYICYVCRVTWQYDTTGDPDDWMSSPGYLRLRLGGPIGELEQMLEEKAENERNQSIGFH